MASVTMTASFISGATLASRSPINSSGRRLVVVKAAAAQGEKLKLNSEAEKVSSNNGRRDMMFAAAAAAICSVAGIALAEPKPGTPEARKVYAPVCVTMPTAKICRK